MKRFLSILMALTLLLGCAAAQEVASPFADAQMKVAPPEGYEVEYIENPDMIIVDLHSKLLGALEYHIVVSKLDFEFMDSASLEDLDESQLELMATYAAGEVETYTHGTYELSNGRKVLVIDEVGEVDECALGYMLVGGYLIGVRADRCGTIGPLMEGDYDLLLEVMEGITFEVK